MKKPFWKKPTAPAVPLSAQREQLQRQFNQMCFEAGDLQYKIDTYTKRVDELTRDRKALALKFDELLAQEQTEAAAEAKAKAKEAAPEVAPPATNAPAPQANA